ncbi:MAG: hypothetical protein LBM61_03325, partial [Prevotellaceae bacterium]|nr:hypothetical protein [Prevotellaceae bacterium]
MKQTYSSSSYKVAAVPHLTLVGSLSLCVCWLVGYFLLPDHLLSQLVGFLFHLLIGYCLILLNNTYAIIRVHASLQTFIYLLLVAVCPFLHEFQLTDVAMLLLLFSVYFIFGSYQQANSVYPFFMSFLFLGIGTLFVPKMVFLSPLWWLGAYYFRSLSLRGWFASLLGWIVPIWLLFVYEYVFGNLTILRRIFAEIVTLFPIDRTMHVRLFDSEMAVWIYALFLFLVCISY